MSHPRRIAALLLPLLLLVAAHPAAAQEARDELLRRGLDPSVDGYWSAVMDLDGERLVLYLDSGISPDTRRDPPQHDTALLMAITSGCNTPARAADVHRIIDALLTHGADVNAADDNDASPLLHAVEYCDESVVKSLLAREPDLEARARGGATPMMMAVIHDKPGMVKLLLAAGYDLSKEKYPVEPMAAGKPEIKRLLARKGAAPPASEPESEPIETAPGPELEPTPASEATGSATIGEPR